MWKRVRVKYPLFLSDFDESWSFSTDLKKKTNTKFNQNMFSRSRVFTCGRTERRTDMTKLVVAFRNFANAPKNYNINLLLSLCDKSS